MDLASGVGRARCAISELTSGRKRSSQQRGGRKASIDGCDSTTDDEGSSSHRKAGQEVRDNSYNTAVINLAKTTIGTGIMAMPRAMQLLGLLCGTLYIILLASVIYYSIMVLVKASNHTGQWTYKGAVQALVGRIPAQVLQLVILMANAGGMTACLIMTADILVGGQDSPDGGLFLLWGFSSNGINDGNAPLLMHRWVVLLVIVLVFMTPLCLQKRLASLRNSSILGLVLAVAFALSTILLALLATSRGMVQGLNVFPQMDCPPPVHHSYHSYVWAHHNHHLIESLKIVIPPPQAPLAPPSPPSPSRMQMVEELIDRLLQNPQQPGVPPPAPPPEPSPPPARHWRWFNVQRSRKFVASPVEDQILLSGGPFAPSPPEAPPEFFSFLLDEASLVGLCRKSHFVALAADLLGASAVILGAFVCHYSIHPIMTEMQDRSADNMLAVVKTSNMAATAVYLAVGWGGYIAFSSTTSENLLKNFEVPALTDLLASSSMAAWLSVMTRVGYIVVMLTTYPLINFSFRTRVIELLDDLTGQKTRSQRCQDSLLLHVSITLATLAFTYTLAVNLPDIWGIMSFVGATGSVFMSFLMPAVLALKMDPHSMKTRLMSTILFVLGGSLAIGGVWNAIM